MISHSTVISRTSLWGSKLRSDQHDYYLIKVSRNAICVVHYLTVSHEGTKPSFSFCTTSLKLTKLL